MKCPACNTKFKSAYELNDSDSTIPWYKYRDEKLVCPTCKAHLELQLSKELKVKLLTTIFVFGAFTIAAFFYSIILFISLAIFGGFLTTVVTNYLTSQKGVLYESNT